MCTVDCLLFTYYYLLFTVYCWILTVCCVLFSVHYFLFTFYYFLFNVYYFLFQAYYFLYTVNSFLFPVYPLCRHDDLIQIHHGHPPRAPEEGAGRAQQGGGGGAHTWNRSHCQDTHSQVGERPKVSSVAKMYLNITSYKIPDMYLTSSCTYLIFTWHVRYFGEDSRCREEPLAAV